MPKSLMKVFSATPSQFAGEREIEKTTFFLHGEPWNCWPAGVITGVNI
jgi:hypothetical protein